MAKFQIKTKILCKGETPPCVGTGQQCRGCFGWPNMIKAAQTHAAWRRCPLRCPITGLTLKIEDQSKNNK